MSSERSYFAGDAESQDELARLRIIEQEIDPITIRHLTTVGVGEGWRCLEVGAGGGSIARWLAERVGPTGAVVAVDIDPKFLGNLDRANVEVRRLDITRDELEADEYDLVHSRLLLMHMDDPALVLRRMINAVRPGGWILAEETDNAIIEATDDSHTLSEAFNVGIRKRVQFVTESGIMDLRMGRSLPALLASVGLVDVVNEGTARVVRGGEPMSLLWIKTWERVNDRLLADGVLSETEIADMRQAYEDPTFAYREQLMQAAWGRRPE